MNTPRPLPRRPGCAAQRGIVAVEFAISVTVFFTLVVAAWELAQLLWSWNAALDAARTGARVAAVCGNAPDDVAAIKARMLGLQPGLSAGQIAIDYLDAGGNPSASCRPADAIPANVCRAVRVTLAGRDGRLTLPLLGIPIPFPPAVTTLPREHMDSAANPLCRAPAR